MIALVVGILYLPVLLGIWLHAVANYDRHSAHYGLQWHADHWVSQEDGWRGN